MENLDTNSTENSGLATREDKKRAAAAAVAVALALQALDQNPAAAQPARSAWQATTRTIQLNQALQRIHSPRGKDR